jgi:hypothetical protein
MTLERACIVSSSRGSILFHCGCSLHKLGISSADKFCKFVTALKTLASRQHIIDFDVGSNKAIVYENHRCMTCIIIPKISCNQRHDLIFEALQISHLLDIFYSSEIDHLRDEEASAAVAAADNYSAVTETKCMDHDHKFGDNFSGSKAFADFASHYANQFLSRPPLCSEWASPLINTSGVLLCSLIDHEGRKVFDIPPNDSRDEYSSYLLAHQKMKEIVIHTIEFLNDTKSADGNLINSAECGSYKVLSMGSTFSCCLMRITSGPLGRSLCLAIYYTIADQPSQATSTLVNADMVPSGSRCLLFK